MGIVNHVSACIRPCPIILLADQDQRGRADVATVASACSTERYSSTELCMVYLFPHIAFHIAEPSNTTE